jgi:hypothetical protein
MSGKPLAIMWRHWLMPRELATRLGRGKVPNREVAYFMLGNMLLGIAIYYSGVVWGNPPWTFLSMWEAALVTIVIVFGMVHCFEAAGGDANDRFAADFNCLSFPISLWTNIAIWSGFWLISWAYRKWMPVLIPANSDFAETLVRTWGMIDWFLTMAAIIGCQILFFLWMKRMLNRTRIQRRDR